MTKSSLNVTQNRKKIYTDIFISKSLNLVELLSQEGSRIVFQLIFSRMEWVNRLVLKGLEFVRENRQMGNRKTKTTVFNRLGCFVIMFNLFSITKRSSIEHVLMFNTIKNFFFTSRASKGDLQLIVVEALGMIVT